MDGTSIFSKTGKGMLEASGKSSHLSRADRAVLAQVDGKTRVAEINKKFEKIEQARFFQLLQQLEKDGFVREVFSGPAAATPAASTKLPAAAVPVKPVAASNADSDEELDFTHAVTPSKPVAPKPKIDLAAQVRAQAESNARDEAPDFKTRPQVEAKAAALALAKSRTEAESRVKAAAAAKAQALAQAEAKAKAESEAKAKLEAERKAKEEAERRAREEAERKAKEEAERRAREEAERKAKEEAERKAKEEAERRAREEAERKAKEEAERKAREEAERKAKEEAERRAREEAERKAREEAERRAREEAERKAREEAERKAKEEAERRAREEAERKAKEEAERKAKEEAERHAREEAERKAKEEAERKAREEAERKAKEDAERKAKEEAERRAREETERKAKEEAELKAKEEAERKAREEAERKRSEDEARKDNKAAADKVIAETGATKTTATPSRAKDGEDDIDISDADLDLDDVKADQAKLAKAAKKAPKKKAGVAARASTGTDDTTTSMPQVAEKVRRPVKWGKPAAITLFVVLLASLGLLHVIPLPNAKYEKLVAEALGRPVKIGSVHLSVISGVELRIENLSVGDGARAGTVHAVPRIGSLFAEKQSFSRLTIEGLVLPQGELGAALFGSMKGDRLLVGRISAPKAKLEGPLPLPPLDLEVEIGEGGGVRSVAVAVAENKLVGQIRPSGDGASIELSAGSLGVPFAPGLTLSDFSMKGVLTPTEMNLSAWDGKLYDGLLSGSARIRWGARWDVSGELKVRQLNVSVLAPALMSDGRGDARGTFEMEGSAPDKLADSARIEGRFSVSKGVLGSFDLARALQANSGSAAGRTLFSELTGVGIYQKGAVQLRDMNLKAGLLTGSGIADIDAAGNLSGRVSAEISSGSNVARGALLLGGTSKEPAVRR